MVGAQDGGGGVDRRTGGTPKSEARCERVSHAKGVARSGRGRIVDALCVATRRAEVMKRATQGADGANQNASLNLGAVLKGAITRHNVILYYSTKSNSPEISPSVKTTSSKRKR